MLSIREFSDREVLAVLADVAARHQGEIRTEYVQEQMNLNVKNPHGAIGSRLSWMRKFGVLDRDETGVWSFTPFGETMLNGQVSAQARKSVDAMKESQVVTLMQDVISARYRTGSPAAANMLRRAWVYGTHPNRQQPARRR